MKEKLKNTKVLQFLIDDVIKRYKATVMVYDDGLGFEVPYYMLGAAEDTIKEWPDSVYILMPTLVDEAGISPTQLWYPDINFKAYDDWESVATFICSRVLEQFVMQNFPEIQSEDLRRNKIEEDNHHDRFGF